MAAAMQRSMRMASASSRFYRKLLHEMFRRRYAQETIQFPRDINVEEETLKKMEKYNIKSRKHPGHYEHDKVVKLPNKLWQATEVVLQRYGTKDVVEEGEKLGRTIAGRHVPLELSELRNRVSNISKKLDEEEKKDPSTLTEEQMKVFEAKRKSKIHRVLKYEAAFQKSINYTGYTTVVYLMARLAQNYSAIYTCLSEIKARDEDFEPCDVYNLGSGLGTVVCESCHDIWGSKVVQYYCEDKSEDMSTLARLLLQEGSEHKPMVIPGVYFRDTAPTHTTNPCPLVVSAFTLLEQPSQEERLKIVRQLWDRTSEYLVLIENGSYAGHSLIQEARDYILQLNKSRSIAPDREGHVFAPCPHEQTCPKFAIKGSSIACTFRSYYQPLKTQTDSKIRELYSYVIIRRGKMDFADAKWPRVLQEMGQQNNHTHCRLCCYDGSIRHYIMTKKKTKRELYDIIRRSDWGDRIPINLSDTASDKALFYTDEGVTYKESSKRSVKDDLDMVQRTKRNV